MIDLGLLAQAVPPLSGGLADPAPQADLFEARQMQALSLGVHIPLVCFGISFPAMILFLEGLWLRTGDEVYKTLAKRWSKAMLLLFAVGVVTGTVLSFEFGLLWPNFTATFGEVFGLGFMLEGFSFFIEAIFIGIYVYGWDRLKPKMHFLCGIPIVITGITGSLMVIAVNGWMNNPVGFDVFEGRVVNVRPWEALFNDFLAHEFVHMYIAGYLVAGFIVAGIYAVAWLKGRRDRYHRIGLVVPLTIAALAAPVQIVVGDWAARTVAERQPIKLAAFEGLPENEKGAPFTIGGIYVDDEMKYGLQVPKLLSLLADHELNSEVTGLSSVPKEDQPPVNVVHLSFQAMIAIGTGLAVLSLVYLWTWWRRRRLPRSKWFYRAVVAAGPLAVVALIAGWITTEVGRQPWVVYGVMRTSEAVTRAGGLKAGYIFLIVLYTALAGAVWWLLRRLASHPVESG